MTNKHVNTFERMKSDLMSPEEVERITSSISPIFQSVVSEYDFGKYPYDDYVRFRDTFSSDSGRAADIERALVWKWGHWGKLNFPIKHQLLIQEIQQLWPEYSEGNSTAGPFETFSWWQTRLERKTRFITCAFIAHLVHHEQGIPIIDQHNYRAMNALIRIVRPQHKSKKKPSSWTDVEQLRSFMLGIRSMMPGVDFGTIDRFLMMYGRNHAPR